MKDVLTSSNFLLYAAHHYDLTLCHDTCEFLEDLRRIKYIKKLITRYIENGDLKERLILNHITVLNNVFPREALNRILFLKMEEYLPYIKPFLIKLNICPDKIWNVKKEGIVDFNSIPMNEKVVEALRKI